MTVTDYSISPNPSVVSAVLLTLFLADGSELLVPCHNEKTAFYIVNNWNNPSVVQMAHSFANR